ncbi:MAG: hypothetical protein RTU63_08000 [Candidatus Thorarchaeota archaeon]
MASIHRRQMFESGSEENNGELLVRLVNFSRVFIYFVAAWVQATLLIEFMNTIPPRYDISLVTVPLLLGLWDFVMGFWSIKPSTRFWNIAFIVPIVSITVAVNTIAPLLLLSSPTIIESIMFGLSLLILLVSFIEIYALRKVASSWIRKIDRNLSTDTSASEIRTYDL